MRRFWLSGAIVGQGQELSNRRHRRLDGGVRGHGDDTCVTLRQTRSLSRTSRNREMLLTSVGEAARGLASSHWRHRRAGSRIIESQTSQAGRGGSRTR
jgi:hypothetical protein